MSGKVYNDIDQQEFLLSDESRKTLQKSDSSSVQKLNMNEVVEKQNGFINIQPQLLIEVQPSPGRFNMVSLD